MRQFILVAAAICVVSSLYADEKEEDRVWLGVMLSAVEGGLKVTVVIEDSPAHKAGLKVGDVIVKAGGKGIASLDQLSAVLGGRKAGDELKLIVGRGANREQAALKVKLEKRGKRDAVSIAKRVNPGMKEKTSKHYRILSDMGGGFVKKALGKMERMFKRYCEFYEVKPKLKQKFLIIVFKEPGRFKKFAGMTRGIEQAAFAARSFGYFEFALEGRPVMSRWIGSEDYSRTLANLGHEGGHQFFWTFVLNKVSVMQAWFDEGLAVNFEVENPYPHNTRFWYLKDSLSKGEWISIPELIANWTKHFNEKRMLCYNECGALIHFLSRKDSTYRKAFLKYLKGVNNSTVNPSSVDDFEKAFGKKAAEMEKEFKNWARETEYKGPRGSGK